MLRIEKHIDRFVEYCGFKLPGEGSINDAVSSLAEAVEKETKGATPFGSLLPYHYVDEQNNIVFNKDGTCGFWYEITPLVGSKDDIEKNLTLFFNDELPEGGYLQFLIVGSHNINRVMDMWEEGRRCDQLELQNITKYRKWFIENCSKDFASSGDGRLARNFRSFVTYSCKNNGSKKNKALLLKFKQKLENKLLTEKLQPVSMSAADLIEIGRDILQMQLGAGHNAACGNKRPKFKYDKFNNLADQIVEPFTSVCVKEDSIIHEKEGLESRIFYPKELPESFALGRMISLLGSSDKVIPARFVISYTIAANLGGGKAAGLVTQGHRAIHAAEKYYTRHDISAKKDAMEWREVLDSHKKGERFLGESMLVMITAKAEEIDIAEESLKSIWNSEDWKLSSNVNLQLVSIVAMLPMLACSMWKSLSFFKLTRFALSGEVVAKLPVQGEWQGVPRSGVLLMGRRGQLFNFNPFYRVGGGGNYNISVMAPSGAGKSFLLEEVATSLLVQNVSVFVMDIGATYKNICHLLGGEMVRFNKDGKLSLNPFASLSNSGGAYVKAMELLNKNVSIEEVARITSTDEEKLEALKVGSSTNDQNTKEQDAIEILEIKAERDSKQSYFVTKDSIVYAKAMLSSMCGVSGDGRSEAIVERAISTGVARFGTELDITKLAKVLRDLKDQEGKEVEGAKQLGDSLYPYTEDGIHGRFFKAGSEASFNNNLTIFEFEELVNDEPLLAVVLQVILMQITMQFLCGDRSRKFMLIVDEAWMIMDFAASFLERFARTVRKYGGSLVVCTQDLSSFKKGPSQKAILESSTWKLILQQSDSGISTFAQEEGWKEHIELIKSVKKSSSNKYSEVLIDTNGMKVVGRLAVDPYSTALYSTEDEDYAFLLEQEKRGVSKHEAVLLLARKYGQLPDLNEQIVN